MKVRLESKAFSNETWKLYLSPHLCLYLS